MKLIHGEWRSEKLRIPVMTAVTALIMFAAVRIDSPAVNSFWLFDMIFCWLCFWMLMHLVIKGLLTRIDGHQADDTESIIRLVAGSVAAFGALGGVVGSLNRGWLYGIEMFLEMALLIAAIGIAIAVLVGAGRLIKQLYHRFRP